MLLRKVGSPSAPPVTDGGRALGRLGPCYVDDPSTAADPLLACRWPYHDLGVREAVESSVQPEGWIR